MATSTLPGVARPAMSRLTSHLDGRRLLRSTPSVHQQVSPLTVPTTFSKGALAVKPRVSMVAASPATSTQLLPPAAPNLLHKLYDEGGQSPWIDNLTRDWSLSGHLEELVLRGVRGLTSNPTIFEKAIGSTDLYDEQLREVIQKMKAKDGSLEASLGVVEEAYWELAETDIIAAAQVMKGLHTESGGIDGYVSLEVSPAMAHDTEATTAFARKLHETLQLQNLMVKIPATSEGLPSIRQMISEGRSINVTLIFSLDRYADVIEAYISGLEALADSPNASALPAVSSVASFFVSRVDSTVDAQLAAVGTPEALELQGKAAVAQAVLAYQLFLEKFSGPRWEKLAAKGAQAQRPLWASTGVKNKKYPDTLYVDSLIGPNTVNTMPDATLLAFADHGKVLRTVDAHVEESKKVLQKLQELGISMEAVAEDLEKDGVKKFADSFDSLLATLQQKVHKLI